MKALEQYIKTYFGISREDMATVSSLFVESELKSGDFFVKQQQYCEKLSFVKSGYLRVFAHHEDKEVTQWIATQGYFITDLYSFVFQQRARWNIQALSDCTLYTIDKKNYERLKTLVDNWLTIEKQFISSCFLTLEDRVFSFLSLNAEERYDKLFEQNQEIFNQVPLQYLASMLGMTPETLSRIRRKKIS